VGGRFCFVRSRLHVSNGQAVAGGEGLLSGHPGSIALIKGGNTRRWPTRDCLGLSTSRSVCSVQAKPGRAAMPSGSCGRSTKKGELSEYADYADALRQPGRFLDDVCTHERVDSALGYLTPAEFEMQWRREQAAAFKLLLGAEKHWQDQCPSSGGPGSGGRRVCRWAAPTFSNGSIGDSLTVWTPEMRAMKADPRHLTISRMVVVLEPCPSLPPTGPHCCMALNA